MAYTKFLAYDLLGTLIWASAYIFGGRFFGDVAGRSAPLLHFLARFGLLLFVLALLIFVGRRIWKQRAFLQDLRDAGITGSELNVMIESATNQQSKPPFIVDLRHPLDYLPDPRVLPNAVRISPSELERHCRLLPRDMDVILYCTCPNDETSGSLAKRLQKLGVHRVRPLRGGFEGWRDAGLPLTAYDETTPRVIAPALVEATAK